MPGELLPEEGDELEPLDPDPDVEPLDPDPDVEPLDPDPDVEPLDPDPDVEPPDELPLTVTVLLTTGQICPFAHALK